MDLRRAWQLGVVAAVLAAGVVGWARGAPVSSQMEVRAQVLPTCVVDATDMDFGVYEPSQAGGRTATSTVSATCSLLLPFSVYADDGANPSGGSRRMANGTGGFLGYQLYRDAARQTLFGTLGLPIDSVGTGLPQPFLVYGAVPGNQNVPSGSYTDTVTVYVDF